jgi:riboflavin synthase alpha subunit
MVHTSEHLQCKHFHSTGSVIQVSARPNIVNAILGALNEHFGDGVIQKAFIDAFTVNGLALSILQCKTPAVSFYGVQMKRNTTNKKQTPWLLVRK